MPFQSKAQQRKCYAMKAQGENGSWDCSEWSEHTDFKHLPKRAKKASASPLMLALYGEDLVKTAAEAKPAAARIMLRFLDKVAAELPLEKQAGVRAVQLGLTQGTRFAQALSAAYPGVTPGQLAAVGFKLVQACVDDFNSVAATRWRNKAASPLLGTPASTPPSLPPPLPAAAPKPAPPAPALTMNAPMGAKPAAMSAPMGAKHLGMMMPASPSVTTGGD